MPPRALRAATAAQRTCAPAAGRRTAAVRATGATTMDGARAHMPRSRSRTRCAQLQGAPAGSRGRPWRPRSGGCTWRTRERVEGSLRRPCWWL